MSEEQSGEIKQVTKVKNPGRQKSGYKLVEWNRKNKEDLQKNQKQEPINSQSSVEPSEISTIKSPSSVEPSEISAVKCRSNDTYMIGVGILSIVAIGLLVYFKMPSKSKTETSIKEKPVKIIRKML